MIGDYKPKLQESLAGCRCGKNHEKLSGGLSSKQVFRYRGYKGIVKLFHKEIILPTANITHFAIGNAIVRLNLSRQFRIISKYTINHDRFLFFSNTTDSKYILVCRDFLQEINE